MTKGALLPGLLLGGDTWGDLLGDLTELWDTGRGEEALGVRYWSRLVLLAEMIVRRGEKVEREEEGV